MMCEHVVGFPKAASAHKASGKELSENMVLPLKLKQIHFHFAIFLLL